MNHTLNFYTKNEANQIKNNNIGLLKYHKKILKMIHISLSLPRLHYSKMIVHVVGRYRSLLFFQSFQP